MSDYHHHVSVMLGEALEALNIQPDGCYVDGTFGRGGHSAAILERLGSDGRLLALDQDSVAVSFGRESLSGDPRFHIEQSSFSHLGEVIAGQGLSGCVNGLLLDLGVSSPQLDDPERGFSFMQDGPLDMRMNRDAGQSAAEWVNAADEADIATVLWEYGEERHSRRIARAIVHARVEHYIDRTSQLAAIIEKANISKEKHKHPATRSFQAIRIFINRELDSLRECLAQSMDVLAVGARLVVISFHSLEDRIVKRFMRDLSRGEVLPKGVPVVQSQLAPPKLRVLGKAIKASQVEIDANPRARSAVLRVAEVLS